MRLTDPEGSWDGMMITSYLAESETLGHQLEVLRQLTTRLVTPQTFSATPIMGGAKGI